MEFNHSCNTVSNSILLVTDGTARAPFDTCHCHIKRVKWRDSAGIQESACIACPRPPGQLEQKFPFGADLGTSPLRTFQGWKVAAMESIIQVQVQTMMCRAPTVILCPHRVVYFGSPPAGAWHVNLAAQLVSIVGTRNRIKYLGILTT